MRRVNKGLLIRKITENPFEIRCNPAITGVVGWQVKDVTWDDAGFDPAGNALILESQDFTGQGTSVDSRLDDVQCPVVAVWTLEDEQNKKFIFQTKVEANTPATVSKMAGTFRGVDSSIPVILPDHNFYLYLEFLQEMFI